MTVFDSLSDSCIYSTMNLASGYWKIKVKESDKPKTAFVTKSGLWEFLVLPFGLSNAPSTFEHCIETVLNGLQCTTCLIYLDDVIVHAKSTREMTLHLTEVLSRLQSAGLKLKPSKCYFYCQQVQFLGHVISGKGIATDPEKIKSVKNFPPPTSVTDIRYFLGLCSYYRRFIKDFSKIAAPLSQLTHKDVSFHWGVGRRATCHGRVKY